MYMYMYLALLDPNITSLLQLESLEPRVRNKKKDLVYMYLALLENNILTATRVIQARIH